MNPLIPPHTSTNRTLRVLFFLSVLAIFTFELFIQNQSLHAQTTEPEEPGGSYSESQAQGIDRMIMCPVCPAETIDQAQVEISFQMRAIVREMLSEGKDRDEILEFFVDRYGKDILAAPPKTGFNLVAWLAPIGGVSTALVAVFLILRSMSRQRPVLATAQPVQDVDLIPYLQLVDRHLDMTLRGTSNEIRSLVESREPYAPNQAEKDENG